LRDRYDVSEQPASGGRDGGGTRQCLESLAINYMIWHGEDAPEAAPTSEKRTVAEVDLCRCKNKQMLRQVD